MSERHKKKNSSSIVRSIISVVGHYTPESILKQLSPELAQQKKTTNLIIRQHAALRAYVAGKKNLPGSDEGLKTLKEQVDELSSAVLEARSLVHVQPNIEFMDLHDQLIDNEKVHPIENHDELIQYRLGQENMNKDCQAFLINPLQGMQVLTGIYRYHARVEPRYGRIWAQDLPGDVDSIKAAALKPLSGNENVTGYYSISSKWRGSGPVLIKELEAVTPADRLETTISPIRDFYKTVNIKEMLYKPVQEVRAGVLQYLVEKKDPVRNFHLGNGACVGWIHVNFDSKTDPIIMNYIYKRESLAENKKAFNKGNGKLSLSPELLNDVVSARSSNIPEQKIRLAYEF